MSNCTYRIDKITNYLNNKEEFYQIVDELYNLTKHLGNNYPDYKKWFHEVHLKGCFGFQRETIFVTANNQIIGLANLKNTDDEKKLCTLYIIEEHRKTRVKDILIKETINYLKTEKPFITINEDNIKMFTRIIEKYDWKLNEIIENYYTNGSREFCFNGNLTNDKKLTKKIHMRK